MYKMIITIFLTLFSLKAFCPTEKVIYIDQPDPINPFENVWNAVIKIESNGDPFAVGDKHLEEWSYGIGQIRKVRLDHYYDLTGIRYFEEDMFDPAKSKEVFMFSAHKIGPYDMDRIIRGWNGSGPLTYRYLAKVKKHL